MGNYDPTCHGATTDPICQNYRICIETEYPHEQLRPSAAKFKKKKKKGAYLCVVVEASLVAQLIKNLPAVQETWVQFLGQEDSPGEGNGNPLQYYCLENQGQRSLAIMNNVFVSSCVSVSYNHNNFG